MVDESSTKVALGEKYKNLGLATAIFVFGIVAFLAVNPTNAPATPGPGGLTFRSLPFICATILIGLNLLYVAGNVRDILILRKAVTADIRDSEKKEPVDGPSVGVVALRRIAAIAILVVYVLAFQSFGFAYVTPVFLFVMFFVFGQRRLIVNLVVAVVGGIALDLLFLYFLNLPL